MKIKKETQVGIEFRSTEEQSALMLELTGDCELTADAAFTTMYHDYYAPLTRKASAILQEVDSFGVGLTSEDIAQEALTKLWESRLEMDSNSSSVYSWLLRVVINLSLNEVRDVQKRKTELLDTSPEALEGEPDWEPEAEGPPIESLAERKELAGLIMAAARKHLSKRQLHLFIEHHVKNRKLDALAKELGVTTNTVKSHLAAARRRLREPLQHVQAEYSPTNA